MRCVPACCVSSGARLPACTHACLRAAPRVACCIPCAVYGGQLRQMPLRPAHFSHTPPHPHPRHHPQQAVLITTYVRTGCWLLPHLQDRFDIELLPPPPLAVVAGGQQQQQQGAAGRADSGSRSGASSSRDGSEAGSRLQADGPAAGSGSAGQEEGEQRRQGRGRAGASGSSSTGSSSGVGTAAELVALGVRLKGCKVHTAA